MNLNTSYVKKALTFHGQPLQKIWLGERGDDDFHKMGIDMNSQDFSLYQERQKYFTFRDRAKRLKLHQFLTKKAGDLYSNELRALNCSLRPENIIKARKNEHLAIMPPYEHFLVKKDPFKRKELILSTLKTGDIVYGIIKEFRAASLVVKPLCSEEPTVRFLADLDLKIKVLKPLKVLPSSSQSLSSLSTALDKPLNLSSSSSSSDLINYEQLKMKQFKINDYVRCEVQRVLADAGHLILTLTNKESEMELGQVEFKDLPRYFRIISDGRKKYKQYLAESNEFHNPNYDDLYTMNGLDVNDTFSLLTNLKNEFPRTDYARELRLNQANSWAIRSVATGIDFIKSGQHTEAFQHLNKALQIDPMNAEALVARGALYANRCLFQKAIRDFEKALSYNMYHSNARKYLVDTLVALGAGYEKAKNYDDAMKTYKKCLDLLPDHTAALAKFNALNIKLHGNPDPEGFLPNPDCLPLSNPECLPLPNPQTQAQVPPPPPPPPPQAVQQPPMPFQPNEQIIISSSSESNSSSETEEDASKQKNDDANSQRVDYNRAFFSFNSDYDDGQSSGKGKKMKKNKNKKKKTKKTKKSKKSPEIETNQGNSQNFNNPQRGNVSQQQLDNEQKNFEKSLAILRDLQHKQNQQDIQYRLDNPQQMQPTYHNINNHPMPPYHQQHQEHQLQLQQHQQGSYREEMFRKSESPPPPPKISFSPPKMIDLGLHSSRNNNRHSKNISYEEEKPKLSFQLKKPDGINHYNVTRTAPVFQGREQSRSPNLRRSRSKEMNRNNRRRNSWSYKHNLRRSKSRSRSRSRSRSYSKSDSRSPRHSRSSRRSPSNDRHHWHHRSRSNSFHRRDRYSRSNSRSRHHYSRSRRSNSRNPSRSPSSFRRSRSRNFDGPSTSNAAFGVSSFPHRYNPPERSFKPSINKIWTHDKFDPTQDDFQKRDDGILIEEIDEIIKQAQKVRKEKIIKHDKTILKPNHRRPL